jgi:hypothetical protein
MARSPAVAPCRNVSATSTIPVAKAHTGTHAVSTSAVMPGHTRATTPAAADSTASSR